LHKGIHHKLKGYAYQQLKKIDNKLNPTKNIKCLMEFEERIGISDSITINSVKEELLHRGLLNHEGLEQ
jgi:hypothetical protein